MVEGGWRAVAGDAILAGSHGAVAGSGECGAGGRAGVCSVPAGGAGRLGRPAAQMLSRHGSCCYLCFQVLLSLFTWAQ